MPPFSWRRLDITQVPWNLPPTPKGRRVVQVTLGALVVLIITAGVVSVASLHLTIPPAKTYGPVGHRFAFSFLQRPRASITAARPWMTQEDILAWNVWSSGVTSWSGQGEQVQEWIPTTPKSRRSALAFLGNNSPILNAPRAEFDKYPALLKITPCFAPAPPKCLGYFGQLDVDAGRTLYSVTVNGFGVSDTRRLLDTFSVATSPTS